MSTMTLRQDLRTPGATFHERPARRPIRIAELCLQEARPLVQAMVLVRFAAAAAVSGGLEALAQPGVLVGALAWSLAYVAVYLFNGRRDIVKDQVNGTGRPLATGALSPRHADFGCLVLGGGSLVTASTVGVVELAATALLLAAGVAYSWTPLHVLRQSWSPLLMIMIGGGGTYLTAGYDATGRLAAPLVLLAVAMTAWMTLVGGLLKDLGDVAGDRSAGRRTLAVVRGAHFAALVGGGCALCTAGAFAAGAAALRSGVLLVPALVLLAAAGRIARSCRRSASGVSGQVRRPYQLFMAGQYAAHAALLAVLVGAHVR